MPLPATDRESLTIHHGEHVLRSAFQPIFSFSHRRLVGHEALLRASDAHGRPMSPVAMFDACRDDVERRDLDRTCRLLHTRAFAQNVDGLQWLFLNVDASVFDGNADHPASVAPLLRMTADAGLLPQQIVIELLETALPDGAVFEQWTDALKHHGFLVALDDFGAGHSNFDRVFRLRPHIVKLDRNVIARAAADRTVRRVTAQMVSLLHECGAQVLIEGVETALEADIALDSDADFVQGYHFGRPQPLLRTPASQSLEIFDVWSSCDERSQQELRLHSTRVAPYGAALLHAKTLLERGGTMDEACAAFVALGEADLCYLLDIQGTQVGPCVFRGRRHHDRSGSERFAPLLDVDGARWSRRSYFRAALNSSGALQISRPYPTMHSPLMTVTLSVSLIVDGRLCVLCGDKLWRTGDIAQATTTTTIVTSSPVARRRSDIGRKATPECDPRSSPCTMSNDRAEHRYAID